MTPDQIKQATDDLISDRDHLNAEMQANGQANAPAAGAPSGAGNTGTAAKP